MRDYNNGRETEWRATGNGIINMAVSLNRNTDFNADSCDRTTVSSSLITSSNVLQEFNK
jgi:hypothetical protein